MCFNAEVSMLLFVMGVVASCKALVKSYYLSKLYFPVAVFILVVCVIQLLEYILWKNQECNDTNARVSNSIIIVLGLQPLLYALSLVMINNLNYSYIILLLCLVLFIMAVVGVAYILPQQPDSCSLKDQQSCRLKWDSMGKLYNYSKAYGAIFFILYILSFVLLHYNSKKIGSTIIRRCIYFSIVAATIYSYIVTNNPFSFTIFGGFWCFLVAALCIFI